MEASMRRDIVVRIIVSVVALGACAFAVVSLATFERAALGAYQLPAATSVHNGAGLVGAHLAAYLLESLGTCAGLVILLAVLWSVLNLLGKGTEHVVTRAVGAVVLVACACTFANASGGPTDTMPGSGGAVGVALGDLVSHFFGSTGKWLLGVPITMMALLLLSVDELLAPPAIYIGRAGARGLRRFFPAQKPKPKARPRQETAVTAPAAAEAEPAAELVVEPDTAGFDAPATQATEAEPQAPPAPAAVPTPVAAAEPAVAPLADVPETLDTQDTAETAEIEDEPVETGRPVTVGYLERLKQTDREPAAEEDDVPTKEHEGFDNEPPKSRTPRRATENYVLPPASLVDEGKPIDKSRRSLHLQENIETLERTLREFGIGARVVDIDQGPVVTRYELTLEPGTKCAKVVSLSDDIAIATKAPAVRIVAPIPGKSTIGIELPNTDKELVRLRDVLNSPEYRNREFALPLFLGKDASGKPIIGDLTKMPHLLIAGATGSGKSVCIGSIIMSFLMTQHPDDVRLILIDPKVVELSAYAEIPHLLTPVVTDMKRAAWILDWATKTMDERYDILASVGVRSISAFNRLGEQEIRTRLGEDVDYERCPFHLPYIVIIVDELADMMMMASKNIETSITRLAQKSRAIGIHIILATQRPSVDVITGLIKSNLPTRISFQVTSKVDSRTILDRNGADKLLGCGDLLFLAPGSSNLIRAQGTFISDDEVQRVVEFIKRQRGQDFSLNLDGFVGAGEGEGSEGGAGLGGGDELYEQACRIVLLSQRGSVSLLQRKLEIGYTRAARLIDLMAAEGIVGDYKGSKAREVVMGLEDWEGRHRNTAPPPVAGQASAANRIAPLPEPDDDEDDDEEEEES